ncbi:MAG: ABC transporter substrate-binding protein [Bdellovibrionota bacterium]
MKKWSLCSLMLAVVLSTPLVFAKTFIYCSEASPRTFNLQLVDDTVTAHAGLPLYNRLVEFVPGSVQLRPRLAESWTVSKDRLEYTFKLRKDVNFHTTDYFKPTRKMNADDVVFSFMRMHDKNHPFHNVGGAKYVFYNGMELNKIVQSIEKVDDYTVKFTLNQPQGTFLANIALETIGPILSKEYGDKLVKENKKDEMDTKPIGTGPFVFRQYVKDASIRYAAFNDYFDTKPKVDNMVFLITPDNTVRAQKMIAGECHMIAEPSSIDYNRFKANPNLTVVDGDVINVGYLAFNVSKAPFDKVEVRQAIAHALNRKSYIDAIYHGRAKVAESIIPFNMWGYTQDVKHYDYNPDRAKQLLAKAGLKDGFKTELWALPFARAYNPDGKKMAELMQADLKAVGIEAKIVTFDSTTYMNKVEVWEHTMAQLGWSSDNGDPDNFVYPLLSCASAQNGTNITKWCDKDFDAIIQKAQTLIDRGQRSELYKKAQQIYKEQVPSIPLAHSMIYRVMAKNVAGYKISPFGRDDFENIELK